MGRDTASTPAKKAMAAATLMWHQRRKLALIALTSLLAAVGLLVYLLYLSSASSVPDETDNVDEPDTEISLDNYYDLDAEEKQKLIDELEAALGSGGANIDVYQKLVNAYVTQDDYQSALAITEEYIEKYPNETNNFSFYESAARLALSVNDKEKAIIYYEKALDLAPDDDALEPEIEAIEELLAELKQ